jgi:site-specific DNA-methyltransferase (adenine-specific)
MLAAIGEQSPSYEAEGHAIVQGDAYGVLSCLPPSTAELVFADPPYNIGKKFGDFRDRWASDKEYAEWAYKWLEQAIRVLTPTGSLYVMTSTQAMPYFDIYLRDKLTIMSRIVWHYDSSGVQAKNYFGSTYEPILFCVKDAAAYTFNADAIKVEAKTGAQRKLIDYRKPVPAQYNTQKIPGNVWNFHRVRYRMPEYEEHPSQKPEALLERIILASSNPGQTVLDPFAGAFTTSAVAKRLGRRSISIESQETYIKIGLRRVLGRTHLNGQLLSPPDKTYERKNGLRKAQEQTGELFNAIR